MNKGDRFEHNGNTYEIKLVEPYEIRASKIVNGTCQRGRPSRFPKSTVEACLTYVSDPIGLLQKMPDSLAREICQEVRQHVPQATEEQKERFFQKAHDLFPGEWWDWD